MNFQMKRLDALENKQDAAVKLYDARIAALESDIMKLEEKLEGSNAKHEISTRTSFAEIVFTEYK